VTTQEFREAQDRLGLKNREMADLLCVSESYVDAMRSYTHKAEASGSLQRIIELKERVSYYAMPSDNKSQG